MYTQDAVTVYKSGIHLENSLARYIWVLVLLISISRVRAGWSSVLRLHCTMLPWRQRGVLSRVRCSVYRRIFNIGIYLARVGRCPIYRAVLWIDESGSAN